jgi:hypothetical protein
MERTRRDERRAVHRLGQILVAARLEPGHHVLRVRASRDHDNRHEGQRWISLESTTHLEPVELGHVQVEQDQV